MWVGLRVEDEPAENEGHGRVTHGRVTRLAPSVETIPEYHIVDGEFERAEIRRGTERTRDTALVRGQSGHCARIDRAAAGRQCQRRRRAAIVRERTEVRVDGHDCRCVAAWTCFFTIRNFLQKEVYQVTNRDK